jgi:hypothetical protein
MLSHGKLTRDIPAVRADGVAFGAMLRQDLPRWTGVVVPLNVTLG